MEEVVIAKSWRYICWIDENHVIHATDCLTGTYTSGKPWMQPSFEEFCKENGYVNPILHIPYIIKENFVGKPVSCLINYIKSGSLERKRKIGKKNLDADAPKIYIGIDKKSIDFYGEGFSVFVLLNTGYSYAKQYDFVKSNVKFLHEKICEWTKTCKAGNGKKAAGLIPFCNVSEVALTRRNEVRITYELKEKLLDTVAAGIYKTGK